MHLGAVCCTIYQLTQGPQTSGCFSYGATRGRVVRPSIVDVGFSMQFYLYRGDKLGSRHGSDQSCQSPIADALITPRGLRGTARAFTCSVPPPFIPRFSHHPCLLAARGHLTLLLLLSVGFMT